MLEGLGQGLMKKIMKWWRWMLLKFRSAPVLSLRDVLYRALFGAHYLTLELLSCLWANRLWKQLSSRPHVSLFSPTITFCYTHRAERKLLSYWSTPPPCSLWYNKSRVSKHWLSLSSGVNLILYGHRQNDVFTVWACAPRLTHSVKPPLFPSSIIGITRVMIIHASVQCVLPAV